MIDKGRKERKDKSRDIATEALNRVKAMEEWLISNNLHVILDNMNFLISTINATQKQLQTYGQQLQMIQQIDIIKDNEIKKWLTTKDLDYEEFFKDIDMAVKNKMMPQKPQKSEKEEQNLEDIKE